MRLGSLCSGAGGLDMAVERVFGAETVWHCEKDAAASKVLAHRWPGVPNNDDLINTDWTAVEPIDVLCAGWPCQPFSLAGKRKGADDERAIWPHIADAVRILRPRVIVLENVAAVLRSEFQRVADSLAALGYDLQWTCLRASAVGAPHRRERLFVVAVAGGAAVGESARRAFAEEAGPPAGDRLGDHRGERSTRNRWPIADTEGDRWNEGRPKPARLQGGSDAAERGDGAVELLPTPRATRGGSNTETVELLPTPRTTDSHGPGRHGDGGMDLRTAVLAAPSPRPEDVAYWGKYEPAIRRWESATRLAPAPTEPNKNGNPRLSAAFSEWLMGWPAGWVTAVPGISRNDQLRIIGNGVVPQQAEAALHYLLSVAEMAA